MGIFSRISDLLKANVNDLIDRAEDPDIVIARRTVWLPKAREPNSSSVGCFAINAQITKAKP